MYKFKELPDPDYLAKILEYRPKTGEFFWKERPLTDFSSKAFGEAWNRKYVGKKALSTKTDQGYLRGKINGVAYMAHRVAWAIFYKKEPSIFIDHINGDKADNRISNLREATNQENQWNQKLKSGNSTGYKGVSFHKRKRKYQAHVRVDTKRKWLGYFDCPKDAHKAYCRAAREHYGEFASFE